MRLVLNVDDRRMRPCIVAVVDQQLSEVRAVVAGDPGDDRSFCHGARWSGGGGGTVRFCHEREVSAPIAMRTAVVR